MVTKKVSMKKYFKVTDILQNGGLPANQFTADVNSNPTAVCPAQLYVCGNDGSTNPGAFNFQVMIDYIAIMEDLVDPGQS